MKSVTGFLSNDNMFFPTAQEAAKHDAELLIISWCVSHNIDQAKVFEIIEALADPITEYVNALAVEEIPEFLKDRIYEKAHTFVDQADERSTEENHAPVLEQPSDGHQPMSDVGSGTRAKSI